MMNTVRRLPQRFASRDAAQKALVAAGYELGVAQWMTTNLVRDGDGFVWQLDFAVMERLLRDFFTVDLWHVVEQPSPLHQLHFLKASRSGAMSGEAMVRLEKDAGPQVHLHHLEGGHWIHAERPDAVTALLARHLP
jgi:pimeloyl-ACP methyl ester carboxylesterase